MITLLGTNSYKPMSLSFLLTSWFGHGMASHQSSFSLTIILPNQDMKKRKPSFVYKTLVSVNDVSFTERFLTSQTFDGCNLYFRSSRTGDTRDIAGLKCRKCTPMSPGSAVVLISTQSYQLLFSLPR